MTGDYGISSNALPQSVMIALQQGDYETAKSEFAVYLDTLEQDERKIAVNFFVHVAGMPTLIPPEYQNFILKIEEKESEMINSMLDSWIKSLEERAKRLREEIGSPSFQNWLYEQSDAYRAKVERDTPIEMRNLIQSTSEYQAWIASLPIAEYETESSWEIRRDMRIQLAEGTVDFYNKTDSEIAGSVAIAAFMIASSFIGNFTAVGANDNLFVLNPVQEATGQLASLFPVDLQNALYLAVNFAALGAIYYAHAETIKESGGKAEPNNPEYVRAFAANMMKQLNGPEVQKLVASILSNHPAAKDLTPEKLGQLVTIAQISMLSVAMAALYKSETNWISGMDYAGMLVDGEPRSDEERVLQSRLQELLQQLPPDMRAKVIEGLMAYMDQNPSIKELMKPSDAFAHAFMEVFNTHLPG